MVTKKQAREIKARMRHIKDAKDQGLREEEIRDRTQSLYQYLLDEGIISLYE